MMVLEHQALAQRGAELVELRLDYLSHLPDLGRLLKDRATPVVITIRRAEDKGRWRDSEEQRQTLLRLVRRAESEARFQHPPIAA